VASSLTTALEKNEQLKREVDILKTENDVLKTEVDTMKDENKQLTTLIVR